MLWQVGVAYTMTADHYHEGAALLIQWQRQGWHEGGNRQTAHTCKYDIVACACQWMAAPVIVIAFDRAALTQMLNAVYSYWCAWHCSAYSLLNCWLVWCCNTLPDVLVDTASIIVFAACADMVCLDSLCCGGTEGIDRCVLMQALVAISGSTPDRVTLLWPWG